MPLNNSIALFLQPIPTNGLPPKLQLSRGERREGPALGRSSTDYRCSSTQSQLSQFSLQEAGFEYRAVHDLPTGERWKQKQRLRHWKPMAHDPWQTVHVESAKNAVSAVQGHWFPGICVIKQVPGICVMKHHWQFVAFFYHWVVSWAAKKKLFIFHICWWKEHVEQERALLCKKACLPPSSSFAECLQGAAMATMTC